MNSPLRKGACLFLLVFARIASGDFGDYADLTFGCPARTTCPVVCVNDTASCPDALTCDGGTLCLDGSCVAAGESCSIDLVSPCSAGCASVACPKVVDLYDSCFSKYQDLYDYAKQCAAEEVAAATTLLTFTEPPFIAFYIWILTVTALIIGWCAFNQRLSPVPGSTRPLREAARDEEYKGLWTQTGYRADRIGTIIYTLVCLTLFGFQALLAILTIFYYMESGNITKWAPVIEDDKQCLLCFIIVWMVGIVWTFALKWPASVRTLFFRRCCFDNATHVAIYASTIAENENVEVPKFTKFLRNVNGLLNSMMALIFSDVTRPKEGGQLLYCRVICEGGARFFYFRLRRYNFDPRAEEFVPGEWIAGTTLGDFVAAKDGLADVDVEKRRLVIGPNSIHLKTPNLLKSLYREFSGTFYTYQNFIIWAWFPLDYYYMAFVYSIVVLIGGITVAYFQYRNEVTLYKLTYMSGTVEAYRNAVFESIPQKDLVPGDVIMLKPGVTFCDMVVLQSTNLVVDESALTGESTPVSKASIDPDDRDVYYDPKTHKRQTLQAGTTVLESSETDADLALVTKTGSFTSKGEMLREILAFERHQFKFDTEVQIVVMILFLYSLFGFAMTGFALVEDSWIYGWFYGIYVFACVMSALLPTVFVVSVGISDKRLSRKRIACVNSESILVAGKVQKALFDKTGTLTKQGLDFLSAKSKEGWQENGDSAPNGNLLIGMACCHTLAQTSNGTLIGNAVDQIMFEATGAKLEQSLQSSSVEQLAGSNDTEVNLQSFISVTVNGEVVTVLKRFDFDHHRMTQSVIVQCQDGKTLAFVKGSAESIKHISLQSSLPNNFDGIVKRSAREGIYQISMAMKEIGSNGLRISRDDLESGLTFIGVLNFKNMLREETSTVLKQLKDGDVHPIMVTGDNVLTGIHIAKECGMIESKKVLIGVDVNSEGEVVWVDESDRRIQLPEVHNVKYGELDFELAMNGSVWESIIEKNRDYALELVEHVRVYGRCTPNDKVSVVSALIDNGYITLMCGDGGNDCGALKTAHVGIALSDAEASIVSPFTSLDKTITATVEVLREGRCALASALASYKYMIMYGQVEAVNQMANAYFQVTFEEWNWVFMDGIWVISMAFTLPLAKAAKELAPERPTSSLLGPHTMASACGVLALNFLFMCFSLIALEHQDWYQCRKWGSTDLSSVIGKGDNYEAQTIFLVTGLQYITSAMTYNFGYTFRSAWIKNYPFVLLAFAFCFMQFYITLVPGKLSCLWRVNCSNDDVIRGVTDSSPSAINNPFNTTIMPLSFRWILVAIMVSNTAAIMGYDFFIVNGIGKHLGKRWKATQANLPPEMVVSHEP